MMAVRHRRRAASSRVFQLDFAAGGVRAHQLRQVLENQLGHLIGELIGHR